MLKVNKLSLLKQGAKILKEIGIELPKGRITLLLGKSGSGKTTLLRCLAQLETGYKGEILLNEEDIRQIGRKQRCQTFGFVPQSYPLFPHMSALENCFHPLALKIGHKQARLEGEKMLQFLGMERYLNSYPHQLSGGQQQRVALGRSLILGPSWLFLDEPTASLDPENRELFIELIERLKREGHGVVISTQDMPFAAKVVDRAYFLEEGAVVEGYDRLEGNSVPKKLSEFLLLS